MKTDNISAMQKLMDNIWLLFALGAAIYFISYIVWGIYEVGNVPPMPESVKQEVIKQ